MFNFANETFNIVDFTKMKMTGFFLLQTMMFLVAGTVSIVLGEWWMFAGVCVAVLFYSRLVWLLLRDMEPALFLYRGLCDGKRYWQEILVDLLFIAGCYFAGLQYAPIMGGVGTFGCMLMWNIIEGVMRRHYVGRRM